MTSADPKSRLSGEPAAPAGSDVLRFGRYEARLVERQLLVDGQPVALGSRAFELLVALIERRGRVVGKGELLDIVWPGLVVEENNLTVQISHLRKIIGQRAIVSVPGFGYRFALAVESAAASDGQGSGWRSAPHASSQPPATSNLPRPLSSFIGRDDELAQLGGLLAQARLLSLVGIGGLGKTRLAIALAAAVADRYPDGVFFVDLAPIAAPELVADAVTRALDVPRESARTPIDSLCDFARSRHLLLVLDNCEHLLPACTQLADAVLRQAPSVTVLATSRERLRLQGEQSYPVPALSLPGPAATLHDIERSAAVRLFVQRARLHQPQFELTAENAPGVAELCIRLDGNPLALELAAARLRMLSVEQIVSRLEDRFRLLTGGDRGAPNRHQTLRLALDWSHGLLSPAEQWLFARLAVFTGGWTVEAAQQICLDESLDTWAVLDVLAALVDKSLVVAEERYGAARYRFLETVRQYAIDRLAANTDEAALRDRHLGWYAELAEKIEPHLSGPQQKAWLDRLECDHDNLRSALAHAQAADADREAGLRLAGALRRFWEVRGLAGEGRAWIGGLLNADVPGRATRWRAKALNAAGVLAWAQGDSVAAEAAYQQSLAIRRSLDDRHGIASTLNNLGIVAMGHNDFDLARRRCEESLRVYREVGDGNGASAALSNLANVVSEQGDIAAAIDLLEQSLAIVRATGNTRAIGVRLNNLGVKAEMLGKWEEAEAFYTEGLAIWRDLGDRGGVALSLGCRARVALERGDLRTSLALRLEGLAINRDLGDRRALALSLEGLADWAAAGGEFVRAARFWGGAQRLREAIGVAMPQGMQQRHQIRCEAARAALADREDFDRAWRVGGETTPERLIDDALAGQPPAPAVPS